MSATRWESGVVILICGPMAIAGITLRVSDWWRQRRDGVRR